jgi:hypothetical protein
MPIVTVRSTLTAMVSLRSPPRTCAKNWVVSPGYSLHPSPPSTKLASLAERMTRKGLLALPAYKVDHATGTAAGHGERRPR